MCESMCVLIISLPNLYSSCVLYEDTYEACQKQRFLPFQSQFFWRTLLICCSSVSQGWKYKKVEKWSVQFFFTILSNVTQSPCGLGGAFLYTAQWRGLARSSELRMHAGWSPGYDRTEFKRTELRSHVAATASQTFDILITTARADEIQQLAKAASYRWGFQEPFQMFV